MPEHDGPLITVARFEPQPEHAAAVEEALREAVRAAHREPGCLLYALHRTSDDPPALVMIEGWGDAEAAAAHVAGPGVRQLLGALDGKLAARPQVTRLMAIPEGDSKLGQLSPS
jgi:quinol monooxygenase YgiN